MIVAITQSEKLLHKVVRKQTHVLILIVLIGEVSTIAGSSRGCVDGKAKAAKFDRPTGIQFDEITQSLLVCDYGNSQLRRVQLNG